MKRHRKQPDKEADCPICSGPVEGYHFGIRVCRPCASFFRRTVASRQSYTCSSDSKCEVSHQQRAMCKGCRYKKCIENGMNPKAVQNNRDPIGPKRNATKPKKMSQPSSSNTEYSAPSTSSSTSSTGEDSLLDKMVQSYQAFLKSERSLYALLFPEKPINSDEYHLVKHTDFIKMERGGLSFTHAMLKEWCPTFSTFPEPIRMETFRSFFSSLVPLMKCFRTSVKYPNPDDKRLLMSFGQFIDEKGLEYHYQDDPDPKQSARTCWPMYDISRKFSTKMARLAVREVEFVALAGIIFCTEVGIFHPNEEVTKLHDQIMKELHENITQVYGAQAAGPRMGSLILLLNDCDAVRKQIGEAVTICRMFGPHMIELWDEP